MNSDSFRAVFVELARTTPGLHRCQLSDMLTTAAVCDQLNALRPAVIATANYLQVIRPAVMHALDSLGERAQRLESAGAADGYYDAGFNRLQRWASEVAAECAAQGRTQRVASARVHA